MLNTSATPSQVPPYAINQLRHANAAVRAKAADAAIDEADQYRSRCEPAKQIAGRSSSIGTDAVGDGAPNRKPWRIEQPQSERLQQRVASGVAVGVVDLLEIIDVDNQDCDPGAGNKCRGDLLQQPALPDGAIGQAGQSVMVGQPLGMAMGALKVGTSRATKTTRSSPACPGTGEAMTSRQRISLSATLVESVIRATAPPRAWARHLAVVPVFPSGSGSMDVDRVSRTRHAEMSYCDAVGIYHRTARTGQDNRIRTRVYDGTVQALACTMKCRCVPETRLTAQTRTSVSIAASSNHSIGSVVAIARWLPVAAVRLNRRRWAKLTQPCEAWCYIVLLIGGVGALCYRPGICDRR